MNLNLILSIGICFLLLSKGSYSEIITSNKNEKISVKCECLISTPLCEVEVFANAAGKPLQTWYQDLYLQSNKPADLNAACYRKRDVDRMGEGLCCTTPDEERTITNLFRGTRR